MSELQAGPGCVARHAASLRVADNMSSRVECVPVTATLREVARALAEHAISCLVVLDGDAPAGIVSERDVVRHAARDPEGWASTPVRDVMSHPLHVTDTSASVADVIASLAEHRVRRLPVLTGQGRLAGIVTQTDLVRAAHRQLQSYAAGAWMGSMGSGEEGGGNSNSGFPSGMTKRKVNTIAKPEAAAKAEAGFSATRCALRSK